MQPWQRFIKHIINSFTTYAKKKKKKQQWLKYANRSAIQSHPLSPSVTDSPEEEEYSNHKCHKKDSNSSQDW